MFNTLDKMQVGDRCIVKKIDNEGTIKRRLLDIGLIPGTIVECLLRSPSGDPYAYDIRGTVIAIRTDDAKDILVEAYNG